MGLLNWLLGDDSSSSSYYYKYVHCYSCKLDTKVCQKKPYVFKIKGIGKLHNRFICHDCMEDKFTHTTKYKDDYISE